MVGAIALEIVSVCLVWLPFLLAGQVVFQRFLRWAVVTSSVPFEDRLAFGWVISFVLNGWLGLLLASVGLYTRAAFIVSALGIFAFSRAMTLEVIKSLADQMAAAYLRIRKGDLPYLFSHLCFALLALSLLWICQVLNQNADIWAFQLPISRAFITHHGFLYNDLGVGWPSFTNSHYANMPLFGNLLFAQALLWHNTYLSAAVTSVLTYLAFFWALRPFARKNGWALWLLIVVIGCQNDISARSLFPLTDLIRSCFSALALFFAYQTFRKKEALYLIVTSLLCGAAISTKYTEGVPVLVCFALVAWAAYREPRLRFSLSIGTVLVPMIGGFWYLKNWILLGNPVHPFLFGHKGVSDETMRAYMVEMTTPFWPELAKYSRDLTTWQGWRDMAEILSSYYLAAQKYSYLTLAVIAVASLRARTRQTVLVVMTVGFFIFFYRFMFNEWRWGVTANLLFFLTGWICLCELLEANQHHFQAALSRLHSLVPPFFHRRWLGGFALACVLSFVSWRAVKAFLPNDASRNGGQMRVAVLLSDEGREHLQDQLFSAYALGRYVYTHNLSGVICPQLLHLARMQEVFRRFGAGSILHDHEFGPTMAEFAAMVQSRAIRYAIFNPLELQDTREPGRTPHAMYHHLKDRLRPVVSESHGYTLYEVLQEEVAPSPR